MFHARSIACALVLTGTLASAEVSLDSLSAQVAAKGALLDTLAKTRFSGFVQARYEFASDTGVLDAKNPPLQGRFTIRRGRLKVVNQGERHDFALQVQYAEDGIKLAEMYASTWDPWKLGKLRVGVQDIPFGFETSIWATPAMELIERSLAEQSLFGGEKDLGAVLFLTYAHGAWSKFDLKLGAFNGNMNVVGLPMAGTAQNGWSSAEFDDGKAFVGRIGFKGATAGLLTCSGGLSGYLNSLTSLQDTVFDFAGSLSGTDTNNLSKGNYRKTVTKSIAGADFQVSGKFAAIGPTILRLEGYAGTNVGSNKGNAPFAPYAVSLPNVSVTKPTTKKVAGFYGLISQPVTKAVSLALRMEWFDPNTEVEGDHVGKHGTTASDIAWTGVSAAVNIALGPAVKATFEYDARSNETSTSLKTASALTDYSSQVPADRMTAQLQAKF